MGRALCDAPHLLQGFAARLLLSRLKEAGCGLALKRDLFIVVDGALALALQAGNACHLGHVTRSDPAAYVDVPLLFSQEVEEK
eukprot:1159002-Pelagomonas_calceolata.AAC.9